MAWIPKANLRGPAGFNATGAAEDDAAIAAFVTETAGPSDTRSALNGLFARRSALPRNLEDFGAVGDGIVDDTAAVQAAVASGFPLYWGGPALKYRITAAIVHTLVSDLVWRSDGASIALDRATSIKEAVNITSNGFNVAIDGPLSLDCANKAFIGWYFYSNSTTRSDFYARGLRVKNCYRASTAMTGGDGVHIRGSYQNIFLERLDIRNVVMATGAGVSGSWGVAGLTISSAGAGLAPGEITILHPYVDGIYCEDPAYMMDQDGVRIFTEEDNGSLNLFDTHFSLIGGTIKNCRGRGVKSQCEFGVINGTKFVRNGLELPAILNPGIMPEIDFQVGGGMVANIECRYERSAPLEVLRWTGTRQVGGKASMGFSVRGVNVSLVGSASTVLGQFLSVRMENQARPSINVSDVSIYNPGGPLGGNFVEASGADLSTELFVRLSNCSVGLDTGKFAFYRYGAALTTFLSIDNFAKTRLGNGTFSGAATAGALTVVTSGLNVRMV